MSKSVPATAKTVRAFFRQNPDLVPEGAEKFLNEKARGRMPRVVSEIFAEKSGMVYAEGNTETVTLTYRHTQPSGRTVKKTVDLPLAEVRRLAGDKAGKRGRLSAAALEAAGEAYPKSL